MSPRDRPNVHPPSNLLSKSLDPDDNFSPVILFLSSVFGCTLSIIFAKVYLLPLPDTDVPSAFFLTHYPFLVLFPYATLRSPIALCLFHRYIIYRKSNFKYNLCNITICIFQSTSAGSSPTRGFIFFHTCYFLLVPCAKESIII